MKHAAAAVAKTEATKWKVRKESIRKASAERN
jgi:hypothetical protein